MPYCILDIVGDNVTVTVGGSGVVSVTVACANDAGFAIDVALMVTMFGVGIVAGAM